MAFSCEDGDAATRAFMTRTSVEVREPISKVTMPLFAEDTGEGWLCATGVLLRVRLVDRRQGLVHVLRPAFVRRWCRNRDHHGPEDSIVWS